MGDGLALGEGSQKRSADLGPFLADARKIMDELASQILKKSACLRILFCKVKRQRDSCDFFLNNELINWQTSPFSYNKEVVCGFVCPVSD